MRNLLALAVLCGCAALAQAQIYKWKDANGNTQYSDTPPPPSAKGQVVNVKTAPVSSVPPVRSASGVSAPGSSDASAIAGVDPQNQAACDNAHKRLDFLQSATKLRSINQKGEVEMLDANAKQAQITQAQADIQKYCQK